MAQLERIDIESSLIKKGFIKDEKKDHNFFYLNSPSLNKQIFTKISHGSKYKTIHDELISFMSKQIRLSKSQFIEFVNSSIDEANYISILKEKQII